MIEKIKLSAAPKSENGASDESGCHMTKDETLSKLKTNIVDFSGDSGPYDAKDMCLELDNTTIGKLVFFRNYPDFGTLRISEIFLKEGYHGLGIGMRFYEDLIKYAKDNHFKKIASGFSVSGGALVAWIKLAEKYKVSVNPKIYHFHNKEIDFSEVVQMFKDNKNKIPKDYSLNTLRVNSSDPIESVFELCIDTEEASDAVS